MAYASVLPLAAKPNLYLLLIFIHQLQESVYQHGHIQLLRGPCYSHRFLFLLVILLLGFVGSLCQGDALYVSLLPWTRLPSIHYPRRIPVHDVLCTLHLNNYKTNDSSTMQEVRG